MEAALLERQQLAILRARAFGRRPQDNAALIMRRACSRSFTACWRLCRSTEGNSAARIAAPKIGMPNSSFFASMRIEPGRATKLAGMS
jgi:hypothetical protein